MDEKQFRIMDYKGRLYGWMDYDLETAHEKADDVLCDLLRDLGYGEVVETYNEIPKEYSE